MPDLQVGVGGIGDGGGGGDSLGRGGRGDGGGAGAGRRCGVLGALGCGRSVGGRAPFSDCLARWSIRTWSDAARHPPRAIEWESFDGGQTTMVKRETRLPRARRLLQTPGRAESAAWASRRYFRSHRPSIVPELRQSLGGCWVIDAPLASAHESQLLIFSGLKF